MLNKVAYNIAVKSASIFASVKPIRLSNRTSVRRNQSSVMYLSLVQKKLF